MAIWQPKSDEGIGKSEPLGRRLFDEPMLAGSSQSKKFDGLDLRHFEESRDNNFSLDRLGRSGIDGRVVKYLMPRATDAGQRFSKPKHFNGWAVLQAGKLANPPKGMKLPPVASPIAGDGLAENIYHAHVVLPDQGQDKVYFNALHLRFLFAKYGSVHPASSSPDLKPTGGVVNRVIVCLSSLLARLTRSSD